VCSRMMCLCRASRSQYPACCGGDYARFAWPPTEATKGPTRVRAALFLAPKSPHCRGFAKVQLRARVSGMRFRTLPKRHKELFGWGLIGASRLVCRIQRRTISIGNPKDVLVTKRYDIRVPVRQSYIYLIGAFLLWGHF